MAAAKNAKPPSKIKGEGRTFEVDRKLGAGCFGEVWLFHDANNKEEKFAVKFEDIMARGPQLEHEVMVLDLLSRPHRPQGFAQCFHHGQEGHFHCMVMELLGKSLEDRMKSCNNKFTIETTVLVAEQLLNRIEYVHSKGIVHRDIKPENFMFGIKDKIHHLYMIDFGLSKRYWVTAHTQLRTKLSLTGTARYASINAHKGVEQSRRDDLEAIGHMLFYFIRGQLPWSGLAARTQEEKYRKIQEKKEQYDLDDLCQGFPDAFKVYLRTTRALEFKERPDYVSLRKLFKDVRNTFGHLEDHQFQWFEGKDLGPIVPLLPNDSTLRQPDDKEKMKSGFNPCACFGGKPKVRD
eukprot:CAMPEP_0179035168 /NCGR_PEP_ID=MMETSP0796-20121207/12975_1 /TAXON_ID=73915 /ORGANISM="Pyrodinium bahamense, Strain pbaha01" /LENGTH=348 /DNA_ID=CAMNT_0020731439 /DNA_START=64 /DNA_END=1110 /DNA_ORIENTATION=-